MDYLEVSIQTEPNQIETISAQLDELGVNGYVIEDESDFRSFLENNRQYWDYVDEDLENRFAGLSRIRFWIAPAQTELLSAFPGAETSIVHDSDWENNWKEFFKPIEIGSRLIIVPQWEEIPSTGRMPLILDPGLIFGTGSHATTRMCLEAIEASDVEGKSVLDLGCGSGILGIGALVLGASSNIGVDIDPKAPDVAMDNALLNGIGKEQMNVFAGDLLTDCGLRRRIEGKYDLVLANIVADVILRLIPDVGQFLAPNGRFISSGIIDGRENEVQTALEGAGFEILEHKKMDEWNCFVCRVMV